MMIDRDFIALQEALAGDDSLERELGRGGMGVVYLAREVQLDRHVAIKVLPQSLSMQPDIRERFLREARLAASLSHPHIARLVGAVRSKIWNSRVGDWVAKLLTPRHRGQGADLAYRPTEMALGVAAIDLYIALPRVYRDDIPELPSVVEQLEAHASAARARGDELEALLARSAHAVNIPANLVAARDAAKNELAKAVATLEALRLDLLRLHGGGSDLHPITTVLQSARELGEQMDRLSEAQRELDDDRSPLPFDLRLHTPT
jgi:hypothetical protein